MISMELQRDVPQYMAIPWLMTCVMARTVSVMREGETAGGRAARGMGPSLGTFCKYRRGAGSREGCCEDGLQAVYFLAPKSGVAGKSPGRQKNVNLHPRSWS